MREQYRGSFALRCVAKMTTLMVIFIAVGDQIPSYLRSLGHRCYALFLSILSSLTKSCRNHIPRNPGKHTTKLLVIMYNPLII